MARRGSLAHKNHVHHAHHTPEHHSTVQRVSKKPQKLEDVLIHNLLELQKIHAHLLERFDKLSKNIDDLLKLFESAARSFVHQAPQITDKDREFLEKIDKLLEQNKVIAKGLTLMEEKMREKVYGTPQSTPPIPRPPEVPRPIQRI